MSAQRKRSRWRRLAWAAAIAVALTAVVWQVAQRALDLDQYRARIETALSEYTGLPVAIAELQLAWHPVPCLTAHGIQIGADDFRAAAVRLDVFPAFTGLLRGRIEITRIDLVEPDIVLPARFALLAERIRGVLEHARAAADGAPEDSSRVRLEIGQVLAEGASLQFGSDTEHPIAATVIASGIGGDAFEIALEAEMPSTGALASASLHMPVAQGGELRGKLELSGMRPDRFLVLPAVAEAEWSARAELAGPLSGDLALAVEGAFEPRAKAAIGGTFRGEARIAPGGATEALFAIEGDGLEVKGSAQIFAERERSRVRIETLRARGHALRALLAPAVAEPAELRPDARGAVVGRNFELTLGSPPQILSGSLEASGIRALWRGEALTSDLRLDARAADGAIRIAELRGGPIDLRGVIAPDEQWGHFEVDLTGTVGINEVLLHALGAPEQILAAAGTLAVDELRAELPQRTKEPARYSVRAQLRDGSLRYESEAIAETFSGIEIRLAGDPSGVSVEASASGAGLGPVALDADITPASGDASGTLSLAEARADWLRNERLRGQLAPILATYGRGALAFEVARAEKGDQAIRIAREQAPRASVAVALREKPEDDRVRDLDVSAEVPADAVRGFLPEEARVSGAAALRVLREAGGAGFLADADLTGLGVAVGEHIEKKIGEPLQVRVEGEITPSWTPRRLAIRAENGEIPLHFTDDGIAASDVEIDVAAWSFLLADGHSASGRVRGSFDSATEAVRLLLTDVSIALSPDVGVVDADGEITTARGEWALRDLRVRGAQSDAVVNVGIAHDRLTGKVTGAQLDADFVREVWQQVDAFRPERDAPDPTPISGELSVALDQLSYGHAQVQQFSAAVRVEQDDIHVRDLSFAYGRGRVSGRVDIDSRTPLPPWIDLELEFTDLSRLFVDELIEDERPGLAPGEFTGKFALRSPLHDDWRDMMPVASGSVVGTGRDGSFGRIGLVTKLLTVLRTTAPLRMRLPPFSDEGLVFDEVRFDIAMESGVMDVRTFELDSISYAVSGTGELNFRDRTTRIPIELNAIRGLTALVERVPVAGDALKIVNVRLIATGSPWDMDLSVASIQDQLIGVGMAGPNAVIKGVRDALELLRRAAPAQAPPPPEVVPLPPESPEAPAQPPVP